MSIHRSSRRRRFVGTRGFTLSEVITVALVSTIMWGAFALYFGALMEATRQTSTPYSHVNMPLTAQILPDGTGLKVGSSSGGWDSYEKVPSIEATRRANILFSDFFECLDQADFVVVLGGTAGYPLARNTDTNRANQVVLQPPVAGYFVGATGYAWGGQDIRRLSNSYAVRQQFPGSAFAHLADPSGSFVVLCFRGIGDLISATECYQATDENNVYYSVQHYREPKDRFGELTGEGLALHSYYRYFAPRTEGQWQIPVGASHYWYRYDDPQNDWGRFEEGPCRVIFPDPYMMAAQYDDIQVGGKALRPVSRFSFFLEQMR